MDQTHRTSTPDLEAYERRTRSALPAALAEDAPVPETWPYGGDAWRAASATARRHHQAQARYDFVYEIAANGYTPEELATGELSRGAHLTASGRVYRPPLSELPPEMIRDAQRLLTEVGRRGVPLDRIMQARLEQAARGDGTVKGVTPVLTTVTSAIQQVEAKREAQAEQERDKPVLHVPLRFRAKGREFPAGGYTVELEVSAELKDWQQKMEAQRDHRGWDAPSGYQPDNWPPFRLVE